MIKAVAVCGPIASGKSSVVTYLANYCKWDTLSFGKFVKEFAVTHQLGSSREVYQNLGSELIKQLGYRKFLEEVIDFHHPQSSVHLIDGIRDVTMLNEVKLYYGSVFTIYLELDIEKRYNRYVERASTLGSTKPLPFFRFLEIEAHPIEKGISEIKTLSDLIIDTSIGIKQVTDKVLQSLQGANLVY